MGLSARQSAPFAGVLLTPALAEAQAETRQQLEAALTRATRSLEAKTTLLQQCEWTQSAYMSFVGETLRHSEQSLSTHADRLKSICARQLAIQAQALKDAYEAELDVKNRALSSCLGPLIETTTTLAAKAGQAAATQATASAAQAAAKTAAQATAAQLGPQAAELGAKAQADAVRRYTQDKIAEAYSQGQDDERQSAAGNRPLYFALGLVAGVLTTAAAAAAF